MELWKDLLGQPINVGDRITYGVQVYGRSSALATGVVLEYKNNKMRVQRDNDQYGKAYHPAYLQYPERIIVITKLVHAEPVELIDLPFDPVAFQSFHRGVQ